MKGKGGQFYLIAALIIIILIAAVIFVFNYSKREEGSRVYVLAEELEIESSKLLDYGAVAGNYPWNEFTKNFSDYVGKEIDITYVIINSSVPANPPIYKVFYYNETGGKINAIYYPSPPNIIVTHNNVNYTFTFKKGENFYFIMSQDINGEYHVITN